jgi:hypothetical protein
MPNALDIKESLIPINPEKSPIHIFDGKLFSAVIPAEPAIPVIEGMDVVVMANPLSISPQKQAVITYLGSLGVAKLVAESQHTPENAWANVQKKPDGKFHVFGRTMDTLSWRRPVNFNADGIEDPVKSLREMATQLKPPAHAEETVSSVAEKNANQAKLIEFSGKYLPLWEDLAARTKLFCDKDSNPLSQDAIGKDLKDVRDQWTETIWESDTHKVMIIKDRRHVNGLHLMVRLKQNVSRQWQTGPYNSEQWASGTLADQPLVNLNLEGFAIADAVAGLIHDAYAAKGISIDNIDVHNSANWAKTLRDSKEEKGLFNTERFVDDPYAEKRSHRDGLAEKYGGKPYTDTSSHFHVYIPDNNQDVRLLPLHYDEARDLLKKATTDGERKYYQGIMDAWDKIPPLDATPEGRARLAEIIDILGHGQINARLKAYQGNLI